MTAPPAAPRASAPSPAVTPPPGNPRFPLLDPIRGLAVAAVVLIHVALVSGALDGSWSGDSIQALGTYALPVLFALSGFLMYRPFVGARVTRRPAPRLRTYAKRRLLRILPAYWVALSVLGVFPGIVGVFTGDFWRYYGFLQIYSVDTLGQGIPQAWSLCVEMTFYVLLPVWAWFVGRLDPARGVTRVLALDLAGLAVIAAGGGIVQALASQHWIPYVAGQSLLGQCPWLAAGMALAVLSVADQHDLGLRAARGARALGRRAEVCWLLAAAAFVGLVVLVPPGGLFANVAVITTTVSTVPETIAKCLLGLVTTTCVLLPAIFDGPHQGPLRRVLRVRALAWFGVVSYGVYLWHLTLASLLGTASDPAHYSADAGLRLADRLPIAPTVGLYAVTLAASTLIAAASYYVVELPFLRRK